MRISNSKWPLGGYSVYCLIEAGKRVRYIGVTSQSASKRLSQHLRGRGGSHKKNWLKKARLEGTDISIKLFNKTFPLERALRVEKLLITILRRPFKLVNGSDGGEPGRWMTKGTVQRKAVNTQRYHRSNIPTPQYGTPLYRLRIEDPIKGECEDLKICQGKRANSIEAFCFGSRITLPHGSGMDALFRRLRHDWALRWLVET